MSDRSNFYFDQSVTQAELDQAFDDLENADHAQVVDRDIWGVVTGLRVTESAAPDLFINIANGFAYDETGRRIPHTVGPAKIDMTSYLPTASPKWVRVYIQSQIILGDPRIDGLGNPVDYREVESFQWVIDEGAEGGGVPALLADHVLICQIQLTVAMGSITNADIDDSVTAGERQSGGLIVSGRVNDLDALGLGADDTALRFGSDVDLTGMGAVQTASGAPGTPTIHSNSGDVRTLGGHVTTDGGNLDAYNSGGSDGNVKRCLEVGVRSPAPGSREGHVYTDSADALVAVRKAEIYDASAMFPMMNNAHAWQVAPSSGDWAMRVDNTAPFPGGAQLVGYLKWGCPFAAGSAAGTLPLCAPLIGIPHGAKLIEARLGYETLGAGMAAAHEVRLWLCRRGPTGIVDLIGSNQPSPPVGFTQPAASTKSEWVSTFETATSLDIVDKVSPGYSYFALIDHYTGTSVALEDQVEIVHLAIEYDVREASGVY